MHIHGNMMNIQGVNFNAVSNGDRAAAAERAAEVRKRLLKNAASVQSESPEESQLIGHWLDARHSQVQSEDEYRDAAMGKVPELG